jgi:sulfatase maturation enzyme AslB (radical SAM superfamily)
MTSAQGLDRPAMRTFSRTLSDHDLSLRRRRTEILQLNVCKLCNLTCIHCHVNAGPKRKEIINRDTLDRILAWLADADIHTVDLTGGAMGAAMVCGQTVRTRSCHRAAGAA